MQKSACPSINSPTYGEKPQDVSLKNAPCHCGRSTVGIPWISETAEAPSSTRPASSPMTIQRFSHCCHGISGYALRASAVSQPHPLNTKGTTISSPWLDFDLDGSCHSKHQNNRYGERYWFAICGSVQCPHQKTSSACLRVVGTAKSSGRLHTCPTFHLL